MKWVVYLGQYFHAIFLWWFYSFYDGVHVWYRIVQFAIKLSLPYGDVIFYDAMDSIFINSFSHSHGKSLWASVTRLFFFSIPIWLFGHFQQYTFAQYPWKLAKLAWKFGYMNILDINFFLTLLLVKKFALQIRMLNTNTTLPNWLNKSDPNG